MIVIIEGADLTGKSTLASALAASTIEILRVTQPDLIFDRIYFSWWAYGPVLGYEVTYMPELIRAFTAVKDARLVLLTTTAQELAQRFARQPDLYFSLDVIQAANARFPSLLPLLPPSLPYLHIDTAVTRPEQVVTQVESFLQPAAP